MAECGLSPPDTKTVDVKHGFDTTQTHNFMTSLSVKKRLHDVVVSSNALTWVRQDKKSESQCVRLRDLIAVKDGQKSDQGSSVDVVYVEQKKDFSLKRHQVTYHGELDMCESLKNILQKSIDNDGDRPKRLLVLVNPVSGFSRGVQNYRTKVAPIFQEANIATDVIVTDHAHHSEEILRNYDLNSIDGLVLVGGDGSYHEAANGIAKRMAHEAGRDVNDPNFDPAEFPVPIGLIPCGTGNGIARSCIGNYDIATAAYSVVFGHRVKNHLHGVFTSGRLLTYSILLVGYGFWSDIIYTAETRRNLGVFRYAYAVLSGLIKSFRRMSCTVEYSAPVEYAERNNQRLSASGLQKTENADMENNFNGAGRQSVTGEFMAVMYYTCPFAEMIQRFQNPEKERILNATNAGINRFGSKTQLLKYFKKFANFEDISEDPMFWVTSPVLILDEFLFSLNDVKPADTEPGIRERILNVDGEIFRLDQPNFHVKMFKEKVPFFCNIPSITGRMATQTPPGAAGR